MTEISEIRSGEKQETTQGPADNDAVLRLILKRIRCRAGIRISWLRKIWAEAGNASQAEECFSLQEIDGYMNNIDDPEKEILWMIENENLDSPIRELGEVENILAAEQVSRMSMLTAIFRLDEFETDLLHACIALYLDPNMGKIYAYLQDHSGRPFVTHELVKRLFSHELIYPLSPSSSLLIWKIIVENETARGEPTRLQIDPFIINWILGFDGIDQQLVKHSRELKSRIPLPHWPVDEKADEVRKILQKEKHPVIRFLLKGPEYSGRKSFAEAVCRRLGVRLLVMNSDSVGETEWQDIYALVQRQAYLDRYAVLWEGSTAFSRHWPMHVTSFNLQFILGESNTMIGTSEEIFDLEFEMPSIPPDLSFQLWHQYAELSKQWKDTDLQDLIFRQKPTIGQIVQVGKKRIPSAAGALDYLKQQSRQQLGKLIQPMNGMFSWEDLIIPEPLRQNLEDFSFEASERSRVWENKEIRRLFPQGRGLIAMFSGSPGTGKTMAAQVIAKSLQMDLLRVDLSHITSKYIGETSKNIEQILTRTHQLNVILLFDEADALFGKRTDIKDAHDRYANTETNYLLQAIEDYPGIVILASNKKANMDAGFMRRLRYVLEFPKPDAAHRFLIWKKLLEEMTGQAAIQPCDKALHDLSETLEITGAQIKMAILSALFISRKENMEISLDHLLKGLERELAKEGRGLGRQLRETIKKTNGYGDQ